MGEGIIFKALSGFYYVDGPEGPVTCRARGKFRHRGESPLVGDRVTYTQLEDGSGALDSILPRRNAFRRPAVANIDALVINPTCENDDFIISISQTVPTVLVNRRLNLSGFHGDFTDSNNSLGVYLLTRELLQYGHKRIYILEGPHKFSNSRERYDGFRQAMAEVGIDTDHNYPYRYEGNFTEQSGVSGIKYMLSQFEQMPTAILGTNNSMTIGALNALRSYHISIPEQMSIVGFNGINHLELMAVRPTVADYNPYDIGKAAGEFILERLQDISLPNRESIFDPVIIHGNATAPPRIF